MQAWLGDGESDHGGFKEMREQNKREKGERQKEKMGN